MFVVGWHFTWLRKALKQRRPQLTVIIKDQSKEHVNITREGRAQSLRQEQLFGSQTLA